MVTTVSTKLKFGNMNFFSVFFSRFFGFLNHMYARDNCSSWRMIERTSSLILCSLYSTIFLHSTISRDFFFSSNFSIVVVLSFWRKNTVLTQYANWKLTSVFSKKECDKSKLNYKVCGNWLFTKFVNKNCLKNWVVDEPPSH